MAYYIKPPDGFGTLEKLRVYALRRMNFLVEVVNCAEATDFQQLLEKGATAVDSDCLIEGSKKDRISHFLLRLICSPDAELSTFLLKAETELFCHRFSCMISDELVKFLKATYRFLCRLQRHHELSSAKPAQSAFPQQTLSSISRSHEAFSIAVGNLLHVLDAVLEAAGSWKQAVKLYMDYSSSVFAVPFQHALCLVASRQVILHRGAAFVPFWSLHVVLAAMFEDILREGIRVARHVPSRFLDDYRMRKISTEVHASYLKSQSGLRSYNISAPGDSNIIHECDIDHLHQLFPPCMSHLHRTLRKKHRLRHFSRIQYTLFLKSIGLPVDDAIHFWKREYCKPASCHENQGGGCQHSWVKDERRYTYGIRHLYGLEGSKTNYRAHSCKAIQMMQLGYGEEGGCPFKHFDDPSLQGLMDIEEIVGPRRGDIALERQKERYNTACGKWLLAKQSLIRERCDRKSSHQSERVSSSHPRDCGIQSTEAKLARGISRDELVKHRRPGFVSSKRVFFKKTPAMSIQSDDALVKESDQGSAEMMAFDEQLMQRGSHCTKESSLDLYSHRTSLNTDPTSPCNSPNNACQMMNEDVAMKENEMHIPCEDNSEATTPLQCKSSTVKGRASNCSCPESFSKCHPCTSNCQIKDNALKPGSEVTPEYPLKSPQMTSTVSVTETNVTMDRTCTTDQVDRKRKHECLHEADSVPSPSFDRNVLDSHLNVQSREEKVLPSKVNLENDLNNFDVKLEEIKIHRPSDFYYGMGRMVGHFNQTS
ncbi:probable DNA primase large subunit [Lytechinus variegatus]|uniref:probable DNA primase large subunit n=1 Tax=Lytechinus variegatus TaxID=7654 RepID=UPI001BB0F115|nr:probable DNA primase large subunit [Lytechinus variegatus]